MKAGSESVYDLQIIVQIIVQYADPQHSRYSVLMSMYVQSIRTTTSCQPRKIIVRFRLLRTYVTEYTLPLLLRAAD
jgi:hypothetical protein